MPAILISFIIFVAAVFAGGALVYNGVSEPASLTGNISGTGLDKDSRERKRVAPLSISESNDSGGSDSSAAQPFTNSIELVNESKAVNEARELAIQSMMNQASALGKELKRLEEEEKTAAILAANIVATPIISAPIPSPKPKEKININTALQAELEKITAVGSVIAARIIDHRNKAGFFYKVEDIKNVQGIAELTFEKLKEEITVGSISSPGGGVSYANSPQYSTAPALQPPPPAPVPAPAPPQPATPSSTPALAPAEKININTASKSELETLSGIGPVIAQNIIDYRAANGLFQKIEDIKNVSEIKEGRFENIKDIITVGDVAAASPPPPPAVSPAPAPAPPTPVPSPASSPSPAPSPGPEPAPAPAPAPVPEPALPPAPAASLVSGFTNVIITEILFNPKDADAGKEFIELYNPTSGDIDLKDWSLRISTSTGTSSLAKIGGSEEDKTVAYANKYFLVGLSNYSESPAADVKRSATLSNTAKTVYLNNANDEAIAELTYSESTPEGSSFRREFLASSNFINEPNPTPQNSSWSQ